MLLRISGWRKHAADFQLTPALFTLVHSQIHFFKNISLYVSKWLFLLSEGCWFEENFLYFHFLLWGSCLPFWKKHPVSLKLRVLLMEGLGCSVRFKALLSPLSPKLPWGSSLNIHERVGRHICDLEEKQRPLINLLSDIKHFSMENSVH